jgi:sigma-B regulation protein RsbU (phosphoserine phosphatase)
VDPDGLPYFVVMPSTRWTTGESGQQIVFTFDWSWGAALRQVLGASVAGKFWQGALLAFGLVFLGLELAAVGAAGWMTRSVTGAVHGLHRATGFIRRGDFSHRVEVRSRDQLGELAEAFNDMSAHIESLLDERVKRVRLEREIEIAAEVQARLFPRALPRLVGAEVAGECRAARGVAGDYYDWIEFGPAQVALVLGDVSGKGISAALLMANLQASLRAQASMLADSWSVNEETALAVGDGRAPAPRAPQPPRDGALARLVESVNERLGHSTDTNRFATLFVALYDDHRRRLTYTNAGHNPALLVHPDGAVERLEAGGMMVGAFEGSRYEEAQATLRPGSVLVIFSDGLTEAQNGAGAEYGEERLRRFVLEHRDRSAGGLARAVFREVDGWTDGQPRGDDQSLVILKAHGLEGVT